MCTEKSKEKQNQSAGCNPRQFKSMFEMMSNCFAGDTDLSNCKEIMERMKETCCGPKKEGEKSEVGS